MAALNIQIEIPNMGIYEMEELKHKLTVYAKKLIAASDVSEITSTKDEWSNKYSPRINRLRNLCGKGVSQEDIQEDERLSYLLSK